MIGWILDLLFSNVWLFIILFWAFRMFSKGFKEGPGKSSPSRRNRPNQPRNVNWEMDVEEIREPEVPKMPVEIMQEKKRKSSDVEKQSVEPGKTAGEPTELPSPVQGMIWSQIYGPPRSQNPHHNRKTR